jgi:succinoglycan biosynthesis transport protein ExoP
MPLGVFPKIYLKTEILNFTNITHRLLEMMVQRIELFRKEKNQTDGPYQILIFSTSSNEGKTVISQNIADHLKRHGKKVMVMKYSRETIEGDFADPDMSNSMILPENDANPQNKFSLINWLLGYPDNRIDYRSSFLHQPESNLSKEEYREFFITGNFLSAESYKDLKIVNNQAIITYPDYVLIEIPSILHAPYPNGLVSSVDLSLMVCRANRVWSSADQGAIEIFSKTAHQTPQFILNGIEMEVIESILGELPKKRSWLRRIMKRAFRFHFY